MIYVTIKMQFIIGLNLITLKGGFFVAKIVGLFFRKKANILMEGQENLKYKI